MKSLERRNIRVHPAHKATSRHRARPNRGTRPGIVLADMIQAAKRSQSYRGSRYTNPPSVATARA